MTLRRLLRSLASDGDARAEFIGDPAAVLTPAGFDLNDDLIGTALVHHADTAPLDEINALSPLLDRFVPLDDGDRTIADDHTHDPAGAPPAPTADPESDPGRLLDDLDPRTEWHGNAPVDVDAPDHDFGTGAVPVTISDRPEADRPEAATPEAAWGSGEQAQDDLTSIDHAAVHRDLLDRDLLDPDVLDSGSGGDAVDVADVADVADLPE